MTTDFTRRQVSGRGIPLPGNDIDTDRIIPARFLKEVTFESMGEHAFEDARKQNPEHPSNQKVTRGRRCSWSARTSAAAPRASTPPRPSCVVLDGRLYERLIVPLGLNPSEAVVIVPHGPLHHLPFQALRGPRGYFIEERRISYAPSASALRHLLEKASPERSHLLAFGNPDLGSAKLALPGAEYEVQQIKALFPVSEVHVGRAATKERFLERAPEHHVLHVAAHTELDEIDPLYSIIYLASTERMRGELEAHELYQLNLAKTSLVALSACNSGLGKVSRGDEVWGFTRSFLAAGARSLVVSLWPVEDASTARLMERFYQGLREASVAESFRQSQLELLRDERFSHPFFWAPFNVVGDWR